MLHEMPSSLKTLNKTTKDKRKYDCKQTVLFGLREALKMDHSELQQSSTVSQVTAVNHQQMLEQTIQRLQGELSRAGRDEEALREEREHMKSEVSWIVVIFCWCHFSSWKERTQALMFTWVWIKLIVLALNYNWMRHIWSHKNNNNNNNYYDCYYYLLLLLFILLVVVVVVLIYCYWYCIHFSNIVIHFIK